MYNHNAQQDLGQAEYQHNVSLIHVHVYVANTHGLGWTVPQLSIMIIYNSTWSISIQ